MKLPPHIVDAMTIFGVGVALAALAISIDKSTSLGILIYVVGLVASIIYVILALWHGLTKN